MKWEGQRESDNVEDRRDEVYLPGFWRAIMLLIRHIPEWVFKRLAL